MLDWRRNCTVLVNPEDIRRRSTDESIRTAVPVYEAVRLVVISQDIRIEAQDTICSRAISIRHLILVLELDRVDMKLDVLNESPRRRGRARTVQTKIGTITERAYQQHKTYHDQDKPHLVEIVRTIGLSLVDASDDALDLVPSGPLHVTWMLVDASDVLPDFWLDGLQKERVDGIQGVREDQLRPGEDPEFVASGVEVVSASEFV